MFINIKDLNWIMKKKGKIKNSKVNKVKKTKLFNKKLLALFVIAFFIFALSLLLIITIQTNKITGSAIESIEPGSWFEILGTKAFANVLRYIFGEPLYYTGINAISAGIVTIAIWLLLFLTFSDIIATFSSFSKWVSWSVGFLIAVIAANIGLVIKIAAVLTGIFSFAGVLAVYTALGAALAAFVVVNLGIWKAKKWILRRRAMMASAKAEAGGAKLKGVIKGLGEAGKGLEELGK